MFPLIIGMPQAVLVNDVKTTNMTHDTANARLMIDLD